MNVWEKLAVFAKDVLPKKGLDDVCFLLLKAGADYSVEHLWALCEKDL